MTHTQIFIWFCYVFMDEHPETLRKLIIVFFIFLYLVYEVYIRREFWEKDFCTGFSFSIILYVFYYLLSTFSKMFWTVFDPLMWEIIIENKEPLDNEIFKKKLISFILWLLF